jgi:hypothetical protein
VTLPSRTQMTGVLLVLAALIVLASVRACAVAGAL